MSPPPEGYFMSLTVLAPGLLSSFQDLGRHGLQHLGVHHVVQAHAECEQRDQHQQRRPGPAMTGRAFGSGVAERLAVRRHRRFGS